MNKNDFKDAVTILFISVAAFTLASDSVFPIVVCILKGILYISGAVMLGLGATVLIRSVFSKQKKNDDKNSASDAK